MNTTNPKSTPIPPVNHRGEIDIIEPGFDEIFVDRSIGEYINLNADYLIEEIELDLLIDELSEGWEDDELMNVGMWSDKRG